MGFSGKSFVVLRLPTIYYFLFVEYENKPKKEEAGERKSRKGEVCFGEQKQERICV